MGNDAALRMKRTQDELRVLRQALEDILDQQGALCMTECHTSRRMVEIASAALALFPRP